MQFTTYILYCINDHAGSDRDHQDIGRHAYETMFCRGRPKLHSNRRRQIIEDNVTGQLPA
jgi:hypothetical protein